MASTPENKVKTLVKRLLANYPEVYTFWPVPSGYGESTLDCLICFHGEFIAVETKAPGKKPTPRQETMISRIETAGGKVFVIDGPDGVTALGEYLNVRVCKARGSGSSSTT